MFPQLSRGGHAPTAEHPGPACLSPEAAGEIPLGPSLGALRDHVQHDQFPVMGAVGLSLPQIQHFPCGHVYRLPSILSTSRNSPLVSVQMPISTSPQVIMGESPLSWRNWGLQSGRNLL